MKNLIKEFKSFLNNNREKISESIVKIEDLPEDDEWIQDDKWEEIYKQEILKEKDSIDN